MVASANEGSEGHRHFTLNRFQLDINDNDGRVFDVRIGGVTVQISTEMNSTMYDLKVKVHMHGLDSLSAAHLCMHCMADRLTMKLLSGTFDEMRRHGKVLELVKKFDIDSLRGPGTAAAAKSDKDILESSEYCVTTPLVRDVCITSLDACHSGINEGTWFLKVLVTFNAFTRTRKLCWNRGGFLPWQRIEWDASFEYVIGFFLQVLKIPHMLMMVGGFGRAVLDVK